ncbi:MAG TPA: carboxylating nicotinate-nucleotide diphosphorylase [Steroidobacteraceae bacterium]|nr:carboxylating nicotinate-nucleotide diphosphorylase [Steroidobacteraceae bacterium]
MAETRSTPRLPADLQEQVARALREDVGGGDATANLVPAGRNAEATVVTREPAVICGQPWFDATFTQLGGVTVAWMVREGERVAAGTTLCTLQGEARAVLTGERTALNFLQLLSATATAARRFVDAVAGTGCEILDTRKTIPGLRTAQKYATAVGGARNHRMGLYDAVLIKENHIAAAGSIAAAIAAARRTTKVTVEVEVESLEELKQALAAHPDIVLLDDFTLDDLRAAVALSRAAGGAVKLEASGGIHLGNVREIAATGVDFISVGSLTKHIQAVDLSMRIRA